MNRGFGICNLGFAILLASLASGCSSGSRYSSEEPTTQPSYWLDQQGSASASGPDFDRLWTTCEDIARDYLFKLDRIDYRAGILSTQPMVTSQLFEPWRWDASTAFDRDESTLSAMRRTLTFEFTREETGGWKVQPKVLVERQAMAERRMTSVVLYRNVFTLARNPNDRASGTRESDAGTYLPQRYWYPVRRDSEFENRLAIEVRKRLGAS